MPEAIQANLQSYEYRSQTLATQGSGIDASTVVRRKRPGESNRQIVLCAQNRCNEAPELADAFGHDRLSHLPINVLVREDITTVARLREMSDNQIFEIRGIGAYALHIIREHFASTR